MSVLCPSAFHLLSLQTMSRPILPTSLRKSCKLVCLMMKRQAQCGRRVSRTLRVRYYVVSLGCLEYLDLTGIVSQFTLLANMKKGSKPGAYSQQYAEVADATSRLSPGDGELFTPFGCCLATHQADDV